MAVALCALVIASGGTALAAGQLVNGNALIAKQSLSGNRLANHSVTRTQLALRQLGVLPSATLATKLASVTYRSADFTATGSYQRTVGKAACPHGTIAVGGGSTSPNEYGGGTDFLIDSQPVADGSGWQVTVENTGGAPLAEIVWAVCLPAASVVTPTP
jgi:hypothetical protein